MQTSGEEVAGSVIGRVHAAWDKLLAGDIDLAIMMLEGVEPECQSYSTFHVVFGSALLSKHLYHEALAAAERALELTPASPHAKLIAEIARERVQSSDIQPASAPIEPAAPKKTLASLLDPIHEVAVVGASEPAEQFNIDRTADELTRERPLVRPIPEPEHIQPSQLPEPEGAPALVSETLAEIMIRQGKLQDAKKVYIQLSRLQPDRYAHFKSKIEAIDKLLLGTSIAPETTDNDPVA